MDNVVAIILAGGKGKRMDILCQVRPKPALPFAGRFRVIDFSLSNCIYSHISNIAVLTDYQRSYMADYLRRWHLINANSTDFHILEPKAGSYHGTANAVYQNLDNLAKNEVDTILVLAGDHVYKLDYRKILAFHQETRADVTMGVIPVSVEQAPRFGTVTIDANSRISEFSEKPQIPQSKLASMGIYVFSKSVLTERLVEDAGNLISQHDFGYSLLPDMVKRDKVFAYRFDGYWQDIGTTEAYIEANMELTKPQPHFSLDGTTPVLTNDQRLPPPHISEQADMRNSLISPGCVIRGRIENSVLSPQVWVDEQTIVRNSIIMGNTYIGRNSLINHCVLDEGVNVGDYCYLGSGSSLIPDDRDATVLGKGASVPSHTVIGRNCRIMPHVEPSDFINNVIKPGAIISKRPRQYLQAQKMVLSVNNRV